LGAGKRAVRAAIAAAVATAGLAFGVSSAQATFHLIKVREVFPGTIAHPTADFVELQMYASGQNFVAGHQLRVYNAAGNATTITLSGNVANGQNQRTVLIAGPGYSAVFPSMPADFTPAAPALNLNPAGGAACWPADSFSAKDCVSWGSFTPPASGYPSPSIPNASPSGITNGMSIKRSIAAHCRTLLENADDTNSSAADFSERTPSPRNNSTAPTEKPCPQTTITAGPSGNTTDHTPTFSFKSDLTPATFECRVDSAAFASCVSPFTTARLSLGMHVFKVRATHAGSTDPTPAQRSFNVVSSL
jgi:hypothetical protein